MILSSLGSGMWYKVRLEFYVTNKEVDENGFIFTGVSKFEKLNPRLALVHHLVPKFSPWTGLVGNQLYADHPGPSSQSLDQRNKLQLHILQH